MNEKSMREFQIEGDVLVKYTGSNQRVVIPETVKAIGKNAFSDSTEEWVEIPEGVTDIGDYAFSENWNLKSIVLPKSVQSIGAFTFLNCEKLTQITILGEVKKFGGLLFDGCTALFTVSMAENEFTQSCKTLSRAFNFWAGKTLLLEIRMKDGSNRRMVISCGQYGGDVIAPMTQEDCPQYDKLLISGKILANRMNEKGRILGMLMRLDDAAWPVTQEDRQQFRDFLEEKADKAAVIATEESQPEYIKILCRVGAITDGNAAKVEKKLKASKIQAFVELSGRLNEMRNELQEASGTAQAVGPEEAECLQWMKTNKGDKTLLSLGIDRLLPVKRKGSAEDAPAVLVKFLFAALINFPSYNYYVSSYQNDMIELIKKRVPGGAREKPLSIDLRAWRDILRIEVLLDRGSLFAAISDQFEKADNKRKALMSNALFRYADGKTIESVCSQFKKTWYESNVLGALKFSDEREAMLLADKNKKLDEYAALRETTADDIRDSVLSDVGLDEHGCRQYDLGNQTVRVSMQRNFQFIIEMPDGKEAKSLPKKGADPALFEAANKDFTAMKKAVKKIAQNRSNTLLEAFLNGAAMDAERWKEIYLNNPVLRSVASLIVWSQGKKTFIWREDHAVDAQGNACEIGSTPIAVAHPMEMTAEETRGWQAYFVSAGLKQPFRQIWEPVLDANALKPDRYKGSKIPFYRFKDQEKHGITVIDQDYHNDIEIKFAGCKADLERIDWQRHAIDMKDRFEIKVITFAKYTRAVNHIFSYLDQITIFERIANDDEEALHLLDVFTAAQIMEMIRVAGEHNAVHVSAGLLEYKNAKFPEIKGTDTLTLDW